MNLVNVILSDVSQIKEEKYDTPYMWNLKKKWYKWTYKTERDSQIYRMNLWFSGVGGWGGGIVREFQMDMDTLLYLKWITKKNWLCIIWNTAQCYVATWLGGEFGGEEYMCVCVCVCVYIYIYIYIYIYMAVSIWFSPETITTLSIGYTPKQNKKLKKNWS